MKSKDNKQVNCEMCGKNIPSTKSGTCCSKKCAKDWVDKYIP
jgi:hypothetical protein